MKENSNAEFFYSAGGTGSDCRPAGGPASILVRCLRGQARSTGSGQAPATRCARTGQAPTAGSGQAGIGIVGKDCRQDAGARCFSGNRENWFRPE